MKKSLIALAVLGAAAGVAQAQSNVTIYGVTDIGYAKDTGSKLRMDENVSNRLGFMGQEDLGGGLKAIFQLEERYKLFNGKEKSAANSRGVFEGAANVGLKGNFGQVRFGRVNELSTETLRKLDPFNQDGVAAMPDNIFRGNDQEGRLSSTTRYDSPVYNGFQFGATYTIKNQSKSTLGYLPAKADNGEHAYSNDGWALNGTYTNGPLYLIANYNKVVDSNDSFNWNIGAAYAFGPAKISLGYEQTKDKLYTDAKEKRYLVGLTYNIGAGMIKASYNHSDNINFSDEAGKQWAVGYTHNLSKRTSIYVDYAHVSQDHADSVNSYMVGMTHKF
ncbi:MAG: porin [Burkholderiaceae bacterium]|nr:porin [Burkholderiaceae bacterium]